MKEAPIDEVINYDMGQLEQTWQQVSVDVPQQVCTELSEVIAKIKSSVSDKPDLAFRLVLQNVGRFHNIVEIAERAQHPLDLAMDMFSNYIRLGAYISDKQRGYPTGRM